MSRRLRRVFWANIVLAVINAALCALNLLLGDIDMANGLTGYGRAAFAVAAVGAFAAMLNLVFAINYWRLRRI